MSDITQDTCYSLSWSGLAPSTNGRDIRRVRMEQLGLILVPNSPKPTELIELVLVNSKEVRNAFFTFMKAAGAYSLLDMYKQVNSEGALVPSPQLDESLFFDIHYLDKVSCDSRPPLIAEYHVGHEDSFEMFWRDEDGEIHGSKPLDIDPTDMQRKISLACGDFHKTMIKAIPGQATKVAPMARGLHDVRFDDVWGNFYYIADELKSDALHVLLHILLHDWFAVATTTIPEMLAEMQATQAAATPYGDSPYADLFYRLRGYISDDPAMGMGGFDHETFDLLRNIQEDPASNTIRGMPAPLFKLEFDRLWANPLLKVQVGRLVAAIWEETSRDTSADGTGVDVAGVLQSLCYALTTDSDFVMGNPAIRDGFVRDGFDSEQQYGRQRPVMPSAAAGTSYRLIDAVRIALYDAEFSFFKGSEIIQEFYNAAASLREQYSIRQCLLWHAILHWFHIRQLPTIRPYVSTSPSPAPASASASNTSGPSERQSSVASDSDRTPSSDGVQQSVDDDGSVDFFSLSTPNYDSLDTHREHSEYAPQAEYIEAESNEPDVSGSDRVVEADSVGDANASRAAIHVYEYIVSHTDYEDSTPSPPALTGRARIATPRPEMYDSFRQGLDGDDYEDRHGQAQQAQQAQDETLDEVPPEFEELDLVPTALNPHIASLSYNVRPNQFRFSTVAALVRDRVLDHEAYIHGHGPFLYVRALGEQDNIVLPPHLVADRRYSGSRDGVVGRTVVLSNMPARGAERCSAIRPDTEARLVDFLLAAFPRAPPLREAPVACVNLMNQAILAILRSTELQLVDAGLAGDINRDHFKLHLEFTCNNHDAAYGVLAHAVAEYGSTIGLDLRLAIVADNRVPILGSGIDVTAHPTEATVFVWIYHDLVPRTVGDMWWLETYRALKPMASLVGHGRESHFWLCVRQGVFGSWSI